MLWDKQISNLQNKIKSTSAFLHGCAHLFDLHQKRTRDIQTTILEELKKVIDKNNKASQVREPSTYKEYHDKFLLDVYKEKLRIELLNFIVYGFSIYSVQRNYWQLQNNF